MKSNHNKLIADHYPNFDLFRMLMAGEVFIYHLLAMRGQYIDFWINPVPAFVGISGFLVLDSLNRSSSYWEFAWKRICRVMPAFVVVMLLGWVLYDYDYFFKTWQGYYTLGFGMKGGNRAIWSLSSEEVLYGVMAIFSALGFYRSKKPIWIVWLACLILIPVLTQPLGEFTKKERVFWLPAAFFGGSLVYLYQERLRKLPKWIWPVFLIILAIGFKTPSIVPKTLDLRLRNNIIAMLGAVAVAGMGAFGPRVIKWKYPDISYGIYIYHWPIIHYCFEVKHWNLKLSFLITILFSILSWYVIEKPALRMKTFFRKRNKQIEENQFVPSPAS
jgi:peptidoglycan/LPS O-acetylase OafA/YrhL